MKKKILMAMMLCVCVLGLTGCNKERTLEVAFKEEQKSDFEDFKLYVEDESYELISDVDIIGNEVFLIVAEEEFDDLLEVMNENEKYEDLLTIMFDEIFEYDMFYDLEYLFDEIDDVVEDYDGDTLITIQFETLKGDLIYARSFDENGIIDKNKSTNKNEFINYKN